MTVNRKRIWICLVMALLMAVPFTVVAQDKININTATSDDLVRLSGIGKAIAQRIIDYRETVAPFKTIEDIKNVKGIGDATFEKIKEMITIEQPVE